MKTPPPSLAFDLQPLEPRLMLSADGAELLAPGAGSAAEVVLQSANSPAPMPEEISLTGEEWLPVATDELFPTVEASSVLLNDQGAWDETGELIASQLSGLVLAADVVTIADGTHLHDLQLDAGSIHLGEVHWSGSNRLHSDSLSVDGMQQANELSVLTLAPRSVADPVFLGAAGPGYSLGSEALDRLSAAGFSELIIGQADGAHAFRIDGLSYYGNLTLRAPDIGGRFDVVSRVEHAGGDLTYVGSGHTQNVSADTVTNGVPLLVNDSLQLVYVASSGNTYGDNTIYFDTTNGGATLAGADILITGAIFGTGEGLGGALYLNAGTNGEILIQGNVGTAAAVEMIHVVNARNVTFEANVQLDSFTQVAGTGSTVFGTSASTTVNLTGGDMDIVTTNNITFAGDVTSTDGDIDLTVSPAAVAGKIWFKGQTTLDSGSLTIHDAKDVEMTGAVNIGGNLTQVAGANTSIFRSDVTADVMDLRTNAEIRFLAQVRPQAGDVTLVSNDINFLGGSASVIGAQNGSGLPVTDLYLRPSAANVSMDIGSPAGGTGTFRFGTADIAALADGFESITLGYATGSTNPIRAGTAAFLDPLELYGGSFLVNGSLSSHVSMRVDAATGDIDVTNTQIRVSNEQIGSVWQSSAMDLVAHQGDILLRNGASLRIQNQNDADLTQGSTIDLTATNGSILNELGSGGFVQAHDLTATAAADIRLLTEIRNLTATSTSAGDITVDELDGLHVISAIAADGAIALSTGGNTSVDLLRSTTDATGNTIEVTVYNGDLDVGEVLAGVLGDVVLSSEGDIVGYTPQTDPHVVGNLVTLGAVDGIGRSANPLRVMANELDVDNATSGEVSLRQLSGRASLAVSIVNDATGAADHVSLTVDAGDTTVTADGIHSAAAAGIRIDVAGALSVDGDISGAGGPLTVLASGAVDISSGVSADSGGGDVVIDSGDDFTQAADASIVSGGGHISLDITGNGLLGRLDTRTGGVQGTWGHVALAATGSLHDAPASALLNVYANQLRLSAGTGVGQLPNGLDERGLEIDAAKLAVATGGGEIVIHELNALITGTVASFTPDLSLANGSVATGTATGALAAVANAGGGDVLLSAGGVLTAQAVDALSDAVVTQGGGRVVLLGSGLTVSGTVRSSGGGLSLAALNQISVTGSASLVTTGAADIAVSSSAGSILAGAATVVQTDSGNILLSAAVNLTLGAVTTAGDVGLRASAGSILTATGGSNTRVAVTGDTLSLVAGGNVNGPSNSTEELLTDVTTLSLAGGAGAQHRIRNAQALTIDTTQVAVDLYSATMVAAALSITAQSDVDVSGNGHIVIVLDAGDAVLAGGRLIRTHGAGTITVQVPGAFTMGTLALIQAETGTVTVTADGTVSVARILATTGAIAVTSANGSIIDADPAQAAVDFDTDGQLSLVAATGVGIEFTDRQTLTVLLGTLGAQTDTGGIFVSSSASLATNGLVTTGGVTPVSVTSGGALTLGRNGSGVTVDATGDVVLRAVTDLTQLAGGRLESAVDISLFAGGVMTLVQVATPGDVALTADSVARLAAPGTEITANGLLLDPVGSVGTPALPLRVDVDRLAGTVSGGALAFANSGDLTIGPVTVSTTALTPMSPLPSVLVEQTADRLIVNGVGAGLLADIVGDLEVEAHASAAVAVTQAIPVLWQTGGSQTWNGWFVLADGPATLRSGGDLVLDAGGTFATGTGSVFLDAGGDFLLRSDSTLSTGSGDLLARVAGSMELNGELSGTGSTGLVAAESIRTTQVGGPIRVTANDLILRAGYQVGSALSPLTIQVAELSGLSGAGGLFVEAEGDLLVANLGFSIPSLRTDATVDAAFSGHQGGFVTRQSGPLSLDTNGMLTVQEVAAVIEAFPGTDHAISIVADSAGPDGNLLSIFFDVVTSGPGGDPPSTVYTPANGVMTVTVRNGVSTLAEIIAAINADGAFPGTAILASGLADGSQVLNLAPGADDAFLAAGGRHEGVLVQAAGVFSGGVEPVSAVAQIPMWNEFYSLRFIALDPGAAANSFVVRLLDDGPGNRLTDGVNAADVEWDSLNGNLNLFVNFGYTTVEALLDAVSDAETNDGLPFAAELAGSFLPSDLQDVIGDAPVVLVSDLAATATLRPQGLNNDFQVTAVVGGPLYNGIRFEFVDDGSPVQASFNPTTNLMTLFIQSGATTGSQVVNALNAEGTFTASLVTENSGGANSGAGPIQAQRFVLRGGAVAVPANVTLAMVGADNDLVISADVNGADQNGIQVRFVGDNSYGFGAVTASYDSPSRVLELRMNPLFASAGNVMVAINSGPNAASIPLTAAIAPGNSGFGSISLATYPLTSGGTGGPPRADFVAVGPHNDFELVADSNSPLYENIRAFVIDDGSITNGGATAVYLSTPRHLVLNVQSGVTPLNTLLGVLNANAGIPVSGALRPGNDGSGVLNPAAVNFSGGLDPVTATVSTVLPSGVVVILEAEVGGIAENGIQVTYALDDSLAPGTATAAYVAVEDVRLLQIRLADAATTVDVIDTALTAAALPFFVQNIVAISGLSVGDLSPVGALGVEGPIHLTAAGAISLAGRVHSETGTVDVATTAGGNLTFDAAFSRIVAIGSAVVAVDGAFANLASTEAPLIKVYGEGPLSVTTGSQATASTQPVSLAGGGDLILDGAGLALDDVNLTAAAAGGLTVDAPLDAGVAAIDLRSGDELEITAAASLRGGDLYVDAENDVIQNGNMTATGTGAIDVTSQGGSILMGADSVTQSDSGDITYTAFGDIAITRILSTDGATIDVTSGGAISDNHASDGLNISTDGPVQLSAQTGVGSTLAGDLKTYSGDMRLRNTGATGDIVITEVSAGEHLEVTELTQDAISGWSIVTVENGHALFSGPVTHISDGALRVQATGEIENQDEINLGGGILTFDAGGEIRVGDHVNTHGGDASLVSGAGIQMVSATTLDADGGHVLLQAVTAVLLAQILSPDADVRIESSAGAILRSAVDGRTNVIARILQLQAGTAIAALTATGNALSTQVTRLTATAGNGALAIRELDDVAVGASSVTLNFAEIDKTLIPGSWDEDQLRAANGTAVLRVDGALEVEPLVGVDPTVSINGDLRLSAGTTLTLDGDVLITTGSAHAASGGAMTVNGALRVEDGALLMDSAGTLAQGNASEITVVDADAILAATGHLSVSRVDTGAGDLALTSGADILVVAGAPATQLTATGLRLQAPTGGIATVASPLIIDALRLSAQARDHVNVQDTSDLEIDTVAVAATTVSDVGVTGTRTEASQSDLTSTAGDILVKVTGNLVLRDGLSNAIAVQAGGAGNVALEAASLDAYADVVTVAGHLTVAIDGPGHWYTTISPALAAKLRSVDGDLQVTAGGAVTQDDQTLFATTNGNIRVAAGDNIAVAGMHAANGLLAISSGGLILDGGDAHVDLIADELQIAAAAGVGTFGPYNAIETQVNRVAVQASTGPIALSEADGIEVGRVQGSVDAVSLTGAVSSVTVDPLFGLQSPGGGHVSLTAVGDLTVLSSGDAVNGALATGVGNIHLGATGAGSALTIGDSILAGTGHITVKAHGLITTEVDVSVTTTGAGSISVISTNGGFTQKAGGTLSAETGNVVVTTSGNAAIAGIESDTAVAISSLAGAVLDNEASRTNVTSATLLLYAGLGIATGANALDIDVTTVSAKTLNGAMFLLDVNSVDAGSTSASASAVNADGTLTVTPVASQSGLKSGGSAGTIVAQAGGGDLHVLAGHTVVASQAGHVLLGASQDVRVDAAVSSGAGNITLDAARDVIVATGIHVTTGGSGQVVALAGGAIDSASNSRFVGASGNVVLAAAGNVILGGISTTGRAYIGSLAGHIRGAGSTAFSQEVVAAQLLLDAPLGGVGRLMPDATVQSFRTSANRVAGAAGPEGLHLVNAIAATVDEVQVSSQRVTAAGSLSALPTRILSDLTTLSDDAPIVLRTLAGGITLNDGANANGAAVVAHGSGSVRIEAAAALTVNADVRSTVGHVTLDAANALSLAAGADVATASAGTVYLRSATGAVTLDAAATAQAAGSSLKVQASGSVTLGALIADNVSVASANGSVLRAAGSPDNITATQARVAAATGIGASTAPLTMDAGTLAATTASGGIFIAEKDDVVVGTVGTTVQAVTASADLVPVVDGALAGLTTTAANAPVVLVSSTGAVTVGALVKAHGSGNVLLQAATILAVNTAVSSTTGNLSLVGGSGLSVAAGATVATTAPGGIFVDAGAGDLGMAGASTLDAGTGYLRLAGDGDITVGQLVAGDVSIVSAAGSILNAVGSTLNVSATNLRLQAAGSVGVPGAPLTLSVVKLSARAAGGDITLEEANNVSVGSVAVVSRRVNADGSVSTVTDAALADLATLDNGDIVLVSQAGSITLTDGDSNALAVSAHGGGDVLLQAATTLIVNSGVRSDTGNLILTAGTNLTLAAVTVETAAPGETSLTAVAGAVTMAGLANVIATGSSLRVAGFANVALGNLTAENVSLVSENGSIQNATGSLVNVTATNLRLESELGAGVSNRPLSLNVAVLSASAVQGDLILSTSGDLAIGTVEVTTNGVTDAAQTGVFTTISGIIVLDVGGSLTVDVGPGADPVISASGDLRLHADADLVLDGDVRIATGAAHLVADGDLIVNGELQVDAGTLLMEAGGLLRQGALSVVTVVDADAILAAGGDLQVSRVDTGTGNLALTSGGDIEVVVGAPSTQLTADGIRLQASSGGIATVASPLVVDGVRLTALAANSMRIRDVNDLDVDTVTVVATTVSALGVTSIRTEAVQSDLTSTAAGDVLFEVVGHLNLRDGLGNQIAVQTTVAGNVALAAGSLDAYADVVTVAGHITVDLDGAGQWLATVSPALAAKLRSSDGDIQVLADGAVTMDDQTLFSSTNGNVRVDASGVITVAGIQAANGLVALSSGAQVLDGGGARVDLVADRLQIVVASGVGTLAPYDALEIEVGRLAAQTTTGPIALAEADAVDVGLVQGNVAAVSLAGIVSSIAVDPIFGLQSPGGGHVSLTAVGDLTVLSSGDAAAGVRVSGAGNVHLGATGAGSALTIQDAVVAGAGHITLTADGTVATAADVPVATAGAGSISVLSVNGAFTQAPGGVLSAETGNVVVDTSGDAAISGIASDTAVSITSRNGAVLDNEAARTNVVAATLRLYAGLNIATGANALDVDVTTVSARTVDGDMYLLDVTGLDVGTTSASGSAVNVDGTLTVTPVAAQAGLVSGGAAGTIIAQAAGGELHVLAGSAVTASLAGHILLTASQNVRVDAAVSSGTGSVTLDAGGDVTVATGIQVATGGAGQVYAVAAGAIDSAANSRFVSGAGNVILTATGHVTLGGISTGGRASVESLTGHIRAAGSNDFAQEVVADQLLLNAPLGGVGRLPPATVQVFRTQVNRVAAVAGPEGLHLVNAIATTVDEVQVSGQRVTVAGGLTALPTATLADLTTLDNGDIVLVSQAGSITLTDGDSNALAVSAHGDGSVLLQAATTLIVNSGVRSDTGNLVLTAGTDLELAAVTVETAAPGETSLTAVAGAVTMVGLANVIATGSSLRVAGIANVTLGNLTAENVSLLSGNGSIQNAAGSLVNVTATNVRLESELGAGASDRPLSLSVAVLSASAVQGDLLLANSGDLATGAVTVTTNGVTDGAQIGVFTTTSGDIVLDVDGTLTVADPVASAENVRLAPTAGLVLGRVSGQAISLVPGAGIVTDGVATPNVSGGQLRILVVVGDVGSALSPLATEVEVLSAVAISGGVYIVEADDVALGSVAVTAGDITDPAQHGVFSPVEVEIASLAGTLLDGGDADADVRSDGPVTITTATGVARTGAGDLDVDTPVLQVATTGVGSVFLHLLRDTSLPALAMGGNGYLYLNVDGDLTLPSAIDLSQNSAYITATGLVALQNDLGVDLDLRIQADEITMADGITVVTTRGNLLLRAGSVLTMGGGSTLGAIARDVIVQTGTNAVLARVTAGRAVDIRSGDTISGATTNRLTHELAAPVLRLFAEGAILPVLTQADRIDVEAGSVQEIHEVDDLMIGRYGMKLVGPSAAGETLTLRMNEAELTSYNGVAMLPDLGTFVWNSDNEVTLATRLVAGGGDILIDVDGLARNAMPVGNNLEAAGGEVMIDSRTGAGTAGVDPVTIKADDFSATAETGELAFTFDGTVRVVETGVTMTTGSGEIQMDVANGNLVLAGRILHSGDGDVTINVTNGKVDVQAVGLPNLNTVPLVRTGGDVTWAMDTGMTLNGVSRLMVEGKRHEAVTRTGDLTFDLRTPAANNQIRIGNIIIQEGNGTLNLLASGHLVVIGTLANYATITGGLWVMATGFLSQANNTLMYNRTGSVLLSALDYELHRLESYGSSTRILTTISSGGNGVRRKDGTPLGTIVADHTVRLDLYSGQNITSIRISGASLQVYRINTASIVAAFSSGTTINYIVP